MKINLTKSEEPKGRELRANRPLFLLLATLCIGALAGIPAPAAAAENGDVAKLTGVLQSGAPQKEKADACRELARIGNREAVAALAALLPDESLSHMARYGLETIPDPDVDKVLRGALEELKGRPLVGVIGSIGVRRDASATKALTKLLVDPNPDVAQAAARALGSIGTTAAGKALQKAISSAAAGNQVAFCEGAFRCAEHLSAEDRRKQAIALYDEVRKLTGPPHQVKTAALRGAILARGKTGLPLLTETLRSGDYPTFAAAARISAEMPGREVTQLLGIELPKNSEDRQILLAQTLGKRGDPAALPALFAAARTCGKPVRLAAIRAVSEHSDSSAVRLFQELMSDSDTEVASTSKEALGALPGREADSAALYMLRSPEPTRRAVGFELVGRRRMASAIPDLFKLTSAEEPTVRVEAVKKLGELAGPGEVPGMLEVLNRASSPQDIEATEQALSVIVVRSTKRDETARPLAQSIGRAAAPQKCALVRALAAAGGPTALAAVREAVKDPSSEVRTTAIRALGTWNNADAAPDLLELARNSSNPTEKMLCLRSYLGLAGQAELDAQKALAMCRDAAPLVQQADEKKLLLGTLGNIQSPDAFALAVPYLDDSAVKEEAAVACVSISEKLLRRKDSAKTAGQTLEPLQKVAQATGNADLAKRAQALLEDAQKKSGQE